MAKCRSFLPRPAWAVVAAGLLLVSPVSAEPPTKSLLGRKIGPVSLKDAAGKPAPLFDLQGKKAFVVAFLSFECPVSNSYAEPLAQLYRDFEKQGVGFVGVNCTEGETPATAATKGKEFQLPFPVFHDGKFAAVDALGATMTPEVFLLDGDGTLRYRGRIDNTWAARLRKNNQTTEHELRQVLESVVAGKPVAVAETTAIGCPIQRPKATVLKESPFTYHRDVQPILQKSCQGCHRPGEVGPFPLMNYRQAVTWAEDIKLFTRERRMPPWKPTEGPAFHNERRLADRDIDILARWVDGGTPEGDPKDAPQPVKYVEGWQLGKPDLVLTVDDDFHLGPTGATSSVASCSRPG